MCSVQFGVGVDTLCLRVHGRTQSNTENYWDSNWLHCTAEVLVGAFQGSIEWQLRNEDLSRFLLALKELQGRSGEALLDTNDGWIDVRIIRDAEGNVEARCQLVDNPDGGNSLEFRLPMSQMSISALIEQLREILERYPIVGRE